MPDDQAQWATFRGAKPVTIRAALGAERTARHAAYRLPSEHPEMHRLDQLRAGDHITEREYQNACAAWHLWRASGLGKSEGIATWLRTCRTTGDGNDEPTAEDELRHLIRNGVDFEAVLMLVRGDTMGPYMFKRAKRGLSDLDSLAARWDGEMWPDE